MSVIHIDFIFLLRGSVCVHLVVYLTLFDEGLFQPRKQDATVSGMTTSRGFASNRRNWVYTLLSMRSTSFTAIEAAHLISILIINLLVFIRRSCLLI